MTRDTLVQAQGGGVEAVVAEMLAHAAHFPDADADLVREWANKLTAPPSAPDYPITATCRVCDYDYRCVPVPAKCGTCGTDLPPSAPMGVEGLPAKWRAEADEIAANNWACNSNSIRARADELENALAQQQENGHD